jgi:hypothetical protein
MIGLTISLIDSKNLRFRHQEALFQVNSLSLKKKSNKKES